MKRYSIFYTITFIFLLTLISITLAFWWLKEYDKQNYTNELNSKYSIISRLTLLKMSKLISDEEYETQMKDFKAPEVTDEERKDMIIKEAKVLEEISADIGTSAILIYKKNHFLKIVHNDEVKLLQDAQYQPYRYQIINIIFVFVILVVIASYIFVYKKLKPLRKLKRQIIKFANGDLNIEKVGNGNDEISDISEALYDSVTQIRKLNESRQLFLRNIMHELKTPITKGRISVEMLTDDKQKNRLISVFERLESLINEFAAIESVTSGIKITNLTTHTIEELIKNAQEIAMIDSDKINFNLANNISVNVDYNLFSIAIKNMIDNAIKYSQNNKATIIATPQRLEFHSIGEKLEKDLSFYKEAFTKGKYAKNSFGLGLYIVDNIIKAHGLTFEYEFKDGINIFIFGNLDKIISITSK